MKYLLVLSLLLSPAGWLSAANVDTALARRATWTESWPDASGPIESREVTSEIWNTAIQAALDKDNAAFLPKRDQPYYLDGPILLKSGQTLTAAPDAEIRLKPGCNTCMVRNANLVGFQDRPVPKDTKPDTNITIDHVTGAPLEKKGTDSIRLLPGVKRFADGSPLDCTVRNLRITGVRVREAQADLPIEQVVGVLEQKPNPDYPKTTPKGGTGKGIWIR